MTKQNPADRLAAIKARVRRACEGCQRDPADVRLLAVGKSQAAPALAALADCGQLSFGENYVDEALGKIEALSGRSLEWHFIGPLQSNKTRPVATHFDWVQSIDRPRIVRRLAAQRPAERPALNVLIQVNLDREPQKAGCDPDQVAELAAEIGQHPQLKLRGLMAIPAPRTDREQQMQAFARLFQLFQALATEQPDIDTLSAGMSDDLEAAIASGSTMIRVGTALFGPRPKASQAD
ncbi:MAG: YggS family pyridoxal phosphate-dependent enzyme [Wenzhouxiangella sp.]|nr:YggS family pyridoxal phosphate-dependent enzyme [Wenzhouxiangella sp.]MCH8477279.1 YggS family pyridoxal phosphate-dependent enzyme [Wenzhouxiangella sp.]